MKTIERGAECADPVFMQSLNGEGRVAWHSNLSRQARLAAQQQRQATVRYIDRPEVTETFADSVTNVMFDGQTLRMELAVTRLDDVKPNTPLTGRRYPACRLVLSPNAALDLINRVQQITAAMTQSGTLKPTPNS